MPKPRLKQLAQDGATDGQVVAWSNANGKWEPATAGDVIAAANIADHAVVRGDGGAKGVQDSGVTISDSDEMVIPSADAVDGLTIGTGTFPIKMGLDSAGAAYLGRGSTSGTFRMSPNANNPQWLFGAETDTGVCYIDADSLSGGQREMRLNSLAGAGLGAPVVVGSGGFLPNITDNTPLGIVSRRFQRGHINHLVQAVDVVSGTANLDDATFVVAQDGTYTLTLPTAAEGWWYIIERQGSTGTVTLAPGGGDTINGGGSTVLGSDSTYLAFAEDATDWRLIDISSDGDVTAAANLTDNSIIRGDGGAKGIQDANHWLIQDNGAMSGIVSTILDGTPVLLLRHNGASQRDILDIRNSSGTEIFTLGKDTSNRAILRIRPDGTNYGFVHGLDGNTKLGPGNTDGQPDSDWPLFLQGAATGNGAKILAGENLGDIALHISDNDDTFGGTGGAIMEVEADQGFVTLFKTYAQTLSDRSVVYGVDQQNTNANARDFNTQFGTYRKAGVDCIPPTGGTTGQVLEKASGTNYDMQWATPEVVYPEYLFYADQLDSPNNSDWTVNALAPAVADSNNNGLTVRLFDDTTEEGVGFMVEIPTGATNIIISLRSRAETSAATNLGVVPSLYRREMPDNAAVEAWSSGTDLTAITMGTSNEFFQYDSQSISLASLGLVAGRTAQFELTRDTGAGGDTLVGDWALLSVKVTFD